MALYLLLTSAMGRDRYVRFEVKDDGRFHYTNARGGDDIDRRVVLSGAAVDTLKALVRESGVLQQGRASRSDRRDGSVVTMEVELDGHRSRVTYPEGQHSGSVPQAVVDLEHTLRTMLIALMNAHFKTRPI